MHASGAPARTAPCSTRYRRVNPPALRALCLCDSSQLNAWVQGRSVGRRARLATAHELSLQPRVALSLEHEGGKAWDADRLRLEMRGLLKRSGVLPIDLLESWGLSCKGVLPRREVLRCLKRLVVAAPADEPMWYRVVRNAVSSSLDGMDSEGDGTLGMVALTQWLSPKGARFDAMALLCDDVTMTQSARAAGGLGEGTAGAALRAAMVGDSVPLCQSLSTKGTRNHPDSFGVRTVEGSRRRGGDALRSLLVSNKGRKWQMAELWEMARQYVDAEPASRTSSPPKKSSPTFPRLCRGSERLHEAPTSNRKDSGALSSASAEGSAQLPGRRQEHRPSAAVALPPLHSATRAGEWPTAGVETSVGHHHRQALLHSQSAPTLSPSSPSSPLSPSCTESRPTRTHAVRTLGTPLNRGAEASSIATEGGAHGKELPRCRHGADVIASADADVAAGARMSKKTAMDHVPAWTGSRTAKGRRPRERKTWVEPRPLAPIPPAPPPPW